MTDTLHVQWTLAPASPPQPIRHCASCGTTRPFHSSGKVRLNANGKRLDAWLIYRCTVCDRTWLRPLLERVNLQEVSESDLHAMEHSSPGWVRQHESDITHLKRHCDTVHQGSDLHVNKPARPVADAMPRRIVLTLVPLATTGVRLDWFLSQHLPLSRSRLKDLAKDRKLEVRSAGKKILGRKITSTVSVILWTDAFSEAEAAQILFNLVDPSETGCGDRETGQRKVL